jgi:hypothetical protein
MPNGDAGDVLTYLAGGAGSGVAVFAIIQFAEKLYRKPLPPTVAFYGAIFLSFAFPLAAYGLLVYTGTTQFSWLGVAGEFGIGYTLSQAIHWHAPDDAISGIGPNVAPAEKPPSVPL